MSIRTARETSLSTSNQHTVTWIPHDFKLNSDRTRLPFSLFFLTVCSLLVSGFQATVTIHFRRNSMSTELSSQRNFELDNSQSFNTLFYTLIAPIFTIYFPGRTRSFIITTPQLSRIITTLTQQLILPRRNITNFSLLSAVAGFFSTTLQQLCHTYIMHHTGYTNIYIYIYIKHMY
jgi:hypothetical protein